MIDNNTVDRIMNDLIYHRYLMNHGPRHRHLKELSTPEYIALHLIAQMLSEGKTYLRELADRMQLPMRSVSKIVGELRDRELVKWAHDGNGTEGTYVEITDRGASMMKNQEEHIRDYYARVINSFGVEDMERFIEYMKRFEVVMKTEMDETEA